ncbi:hypothetical protein [Candidatus Pyrohabitans sp.]
MKRIYFSLLLFVLLSAGVSDAQFVKVIAISNYTIEVDAGESVHVKNTITLRNLINSPIVPGMGELRLQKRSPVKVLFFSIPFTEKKSAVEVENVKAYTRDGKKIPVNVKDEGDYTTLVYELWYPVEPGEEITFVVEYSSADLAEGGILFRDVSIPVGSDIEVENVAVVFNSEWKTVYKQMGPDKLPAGGMTFYRAEFSPLPLPQLGMKWSLLFWSIILLLSVVVLIYLRKRQKNVQ